MPLTQQDIRPGAVAFFQTAILYASPDLRCSAAGGVLRDGPFLCVQARDGQSLWLQIIGSSGKDRQRLELLGKWRSQGSPAWQSRAQFIHDERHTLIGPDALFIQAAAAELPFPAGRASLSPEGIAKVLERITAAGSPTL